MGTPLDIQDSEEYKFALYNPDVQINPVIKSLEQIIKHKPLWDENTEILSALLNIRTKTQKKPFWTTIPALAESNPEFFEAIIKYCTIDVNGGNYFPLFSIVKVKAKRIPETGIICGYDKTVKKKFQITLADGSSNWYPANKIEDFNDLTILLTSCLSNTQVGGENLKHVDPKNREEAMKRHDWPLYETAEKLELRHVVEMKYLKDLTKVRPKGVHMHTTRLVYQLKFLADGTIDKYKVRFVIRGFTFEKGTDYYEVYAPSTQLLSIKLFYYLGLRLGLIDVTYDVQSAFLQAQMDTDVWVEMPSGIEIEGCRYARLNKAVPGTPQGAYLWYRKLRHLLVSDGFTQGNADPCFYHYYTKSVICLFLIHIDEMLCMCSDRTWIEN